MTSSRPDVTVTSTCMTGIFQGYTSFGKHGRPFPWLFLSVPPAGSLSHWQLCYVVFRFDASLLHGVMAPSDIATAQHMLFLSSVSKRPPCSIDDVCHAC